MSSETLHIFDARRNMHLQGFSGPSATTTIHDATETGLAVSGIFQTTEDFAFLCLFNAYDYFNHLRLKHLPRTGKTSTGTPRPCYARLLRLSERTRGRGYCEMARCHFCCKWLLWGAGAPFYTLCVPCWRKWYYACRDELLEAAQSGEVFRIPSVHLEFAWNGDRNVQFRNLEGDLTFMEDAIGFLAYWIGSGHLPGELLRSGTLGATLGVIGVLGDSLGRRASDDSSILAARPETDLALLEIRSRAQRFQRGENPAQPLVPLAHAIRLFPFVAAVRRKDLTGVHATPIRQEVGPVMFTVTTSSARLQMSLNDHPIWASPGGLTPGWAVRTWRDAVGQIAHYQRHA